MRIHMTLLAATAALFVAASVPALADTAEGVARSSGTLRAGPGTEYPAVDHISRGDDLEIYGCTRGYEWCDVSIDDNRGWFPGSRIAYVEDGRQVIIQNVGPQIGIGILGFGARDYFQQHYRDRPFYNQYQRFDNGRPGGNNRQTDRGPGVPPPVTPGRRGPNDQQRPNPDVRPNNPVRRPPNPDFQAGHPAPNVQQQRQPPVAQRPPQPVRPQEQRNAPAARAPAPAPAAHGPNPDFGGGGCAPGKECR